MFQELKPEDVEGGEVEDRRTDFKVSSSLPSLLLLLDLPCIYHSSLIAHSSRNIYTHAAANMAKRLLDLPDELLKNITRRLHPPEEDY